MVMHSIRVMAALLAAATLAGAAPQRIISTSPGITEILFALGAGARVAGVTDYCKYPPEAGKIPKIGSWASPNMEVILATRPDLVVVQKTAVHDAARFRAAGLHTLEVHLDRIADIYSAIAAIGAEAGVPERARQLSGSIRKQLAEVQSRVAGRPPASVMFVVGRTPGSLEGIVAVGSTSYLSEVMTLAGGRNILSDSRVAYPKVLHEEILARNPDVIIDMGEHADAAALTPRQVASEIALWGRYPTIDAVRNRRVHIVASEIFVVPGPRVAECARSLARLLHPEVFR
jgi:iron complex transport system substrate-binding protein